MIYKMKENFWGFADSFTIDDKNDKPCFIVKGKAFSWGNKLSFQDTEGHELAFISEKKLSFSPCYEIHVKGKLFAEIKKEFSWFSKKFLLDIPGPNDYEIEGSFWKHDYQFRRREGLVANVSKKMFSWTDSYAVDIKEGEDDIAILCACVVIDQVLHDEES